MHGEINTGMHVATPQAQISTYAGTSGVARIANLPWQGMGTEFVDVFAQVQELLCLSGCFWVCFRAH